MARVYEEYKIQVAIVEHHARAFYPQAWLIAHQVAVRSAKEGFFNKQMGVTKGTHDLQIIWKDGNQVTQIGFVEVKSSAGRLNPDQNKFASKASYYGARTGAVKSVSEYHALLKSWGIKASSELIQEADLMTREQKDNLIRDFYSPL